MFRGSPLYFMTCLAQSERIMFQIKLECSSFSERMMALGMQAKSRENDGVMSWPTTSDARAV